MHKHTHNVAIFWDYENCPAPASASGWEIVKEIRRVAQDYGSIKIFRAYLELPENPSSPDSRSFQLRSELQASGVSLTDCPHNGRKDVADKMILVDMMAHAIDNPAPWTFILISGDRDFAYAISVLSLRQYRVILLSPSTAHVSLKSQATTCVDWGNILGRLATGSTCRKPTPSQPQGQSSAPQLNSTNIPPASFRERYLSVSNTNELRSNSNDTDLTKYLKACGKYRRPSISSDDSQSIFSYSSPNSMHTAYFSASETPIFPPPLRESHAESTSTYSSVDSTNQYSSPLPKPPLSFPTLISGSSVQVPITKPNAVFYPEAPQVPKVAPPSEPTIVHPSPLNAKPSVPDIFLPLVNLLRTRLVNGTRCASREYLAFVLDQDSRVYSLAKVEKFGQYIALAEKNKIVTQGSSGITLRSEWA